jgi:hypothetical protein
VITHQLINLNLELSRHATHGTKASSQRPERSRQVLRADHDQRDHDNHHEFHPGDAHHDEARSSRGIPWPRQDSKGRCKRSGIRYPIGIPQAGAILQFRLDKIVHVDCPGQEEQFRKTAKRIRRKAKLRLPSGFGPESLCCSLPPYFSPVQSRRPNGILHAFIS